MTPNQLPTLPEPFALSVSVHDGETPEKTYVECLLYQKHPNEKQRVYTADQVHAYALAALAQQAQPVAWAPIPTSAGGRKAVFEFFRNKLKRHDFDRYINEALAADFACVLGGYLAANTTPQPQPAPKVPEKCLTCSGHGLIGGHMPDGSGHGELCPDCNAPPVPAPVDEREAFKVELANMPEWAPEFECHRAWVEHLLWTFWQARAALQSPAPQATKGGEA